MPHPTPPRSRIRPCLWAALPLAVAAGLRLHNLGALEPFVDEGANILTALDPRVSGAFEPLEQGRPWLVYLFKPSGWFPSHALAIARLMSVLAALVTLASLGWALRNLAGRTVALAGMWLWALLPIAVFHERLALQDPFITALLALALALVVAGSRAADGKKRIPGTLETSPAGSDGFCGSELARDGAGSQASPPPPFPNRWKQAFGASGSARINRLFFALAGLLLGSAVLLKISALLALPWLGLLFLAVQRHFRRPLCDGRPAWLAAGFLLPVLSLGPDVLRLGSKLGRYDALPSLSGNFADAFAERLMAQLGWYAGYGGWPLFMFLGLALASHWHGRNPVAWMCGLGWLLSLATSSLLYNNAYARYLLPDHLPLVLFIALAAGAAPSFVPQGKKWRNAAFALLVVPLAVWGMAGWRIGSDPERAPIPAREIAQYVTGPWSGRGLDEVRHYLAAYADRNDVRCLVLTHRFLRPGCYGLLLAELGDPRIGVVPLTLYEPEELAAISPGLLRATHGTPVAFFLLYEGSLYPAHPWLDAPGAPTRAVLKVPRGEHEAFALYQFTPVP